MIYGVVEHHEDGDSSLFPYFVVDSRVERADASYIGPKFKKAEAEIITFALSTIARGGTLCAMDAPMLGDLFAAGYGVVAYDGPTEGVA